MPSRKKNKGRERREKKAHNAAIDSGGPCTHGFDEALRGNDCRRFMNDFRGFCCGRRVTRRRAQQSDAGPPNMLVAQDALDAIEHAGGRNPDVWEGATNRAVIKSELLSDGVNFLLYPHPTESGRGERAAGGLVGALVRLDRYEASDHLRDKEVVMRERDATLGCERGLVEWYRDRIPCSCLDEKWAQLRSVRRTALCPHCYERKPRSTFLICTGCERQQYCSKACAVAHWPAHKEICTRYRVRGKKQSSQWDETPSPRTAVEDLQPLSFEEQEALSEAINHLPEYLLPGLMRIIRESNLVNDDDDEIDLDIDQLDIRTQRKLQSFVIHLPEVLVKKKKST